MIETTFSDFTSAIADDPLPLAVVLPLMTGLLNQGQQGVIAAVNSGQFH